ncbi:MAG: hypothetical protein DRQ60_01580 [Gammaproteobacteria bacterium]|nr:MAG: hypothetical protein DRQ60_01580 [Gammaproteobacteria bacterium]
MTSTTPTGIDLKLFTEMQELMEEEFSPLVETYLEDTPKLLAEINNAVASDSVDLSALASAAHQLKSTSASLGFTDLEKHAETMERIGLATIAGDPAPSYQAAQLSYSLLRLFLEGHLT